MSLLGIYQVAGVSMSGPTRGYLCDNLVHRVRVKVRQFGRLVPTMFCLCKILSFRKMRRKNYREVASLRRFPDKLLSMRCVKLRTESALKSTSDPCTEKNPTCHRCVKCNREINVIKA